MKWTALHLSRALINRTTTIYRQGDARWPAPPVHNEVTRLSVYFEITNNLSISKILIKYLT